MNLNNYQKKAAETVKDSIKGNVAYFALGLCGESGEVAEKIKKGLRDGKLDRDDLVLELGDVLWYVSQLANVAEIELAEVAKRNIEKLQSRKRRDKISGSGDKR
jgi:NTP pyrophosphatase (non-canonical NTP hydrolase)